MAKQLTKEEREKMEQDPLINFYTTVAAYFTKYRQMILGIGGAAILIIALSIGYYYYSKSQEKEAQQLLFTAEELYRQGNYEKALTGDDRTFSAGFETVVDNYSGTDAANLALYYAAVCEFNLNNPEQAYAYIKDHEPADGILGVGPVSFHAVVLNELERYQEAADQFEIAAEWNINESTTPFNLMEAADAHHKSGNNKRAMKLAERVLEEYPDSPVATDARRLKGMLMMAIGK